MTDLLQDVRLTARALMRDRTFTGMAVGMLAIGIAANVTIFAVLEAVLLRPLPYPEPDQLVYLTELTPDGLEFSASEPNYLDFREQQSTLADLAALQHAAFDLVGEGAPVRLTGAAVTASFFDVLGVEPQLGRAFTDAEDVRGADDVVVLSHALWTERFAADPTVLNSSVQLSGRTRTVIGIMPPAFEFGETELWVPLAPSAAADRGNHWLDLIGRLAPGTGVQAAQADLAGVSARIGQQHPEVRNWSVAVQPLSVWMVGADVSRGVWIMMAAVGLLLLLACANVGSLFLARNNARRGEFAVRAALGAGRLQLGRSLMIEAALIACGGALLGVLVSTWSIDAIATLGSDRVPRLEGLSMNRWHAAFALALTCGTTVLFGTVPAAGADRQDLHRLLRSSARAGVHRRSARLREALVTAQVAIAMMLILGSGLLLSTFLQLRATNTGFDAENLLAVPLELTSDRYEMGDGSMSIFYQQLAARAAAIPGVEAAGATTTHPFTTWRLVNDVTPVERAAQTGPGGFLQADWRVVTSGYFAAARIPLLAGRLHEPTDTHERATVAVVTRSFAESMWPDRDAVGRSFYWGGTDGEPIEVIGVVGDVRDMELAAEAPPMMFLSARQLAMPMMTLLVRTRADVDGMADAIRAAAWSIDPALPVPTVARVVDDRSSALATPRSQAALMTMFALLALLVAAIGIYALVSWQVTSRGRELGIRAALGARRGALLILVMRRQAAVIGAGLVIGLGASLLLGRALAAVLMDMATPDPVVFVGAAALILIVALIAAWLPARRTSRVDPAVVLRSE